MYYSRQFTLPSAGVPKEMEGILEEINEKEGTIVSVTQSSVEIDGAIRISAIIIYTA